MSKLVPPPPKVAVLATGVASGAASALVDVTGAAGVTFAITATGTAAGGGSFTFPAKIAGGVQADIPISDTRGGFAASSTALAASVDMTAGFNLNIQPAAGTTSRAPRFGPLQVGLKVTDANLSLINITAYVWYG